jgi:hypothetical protein
MTDPTRHWINIPIYIENYGITNEKICPLCELEHDEEESLEGRYKAGFYFIKCEQREIEITA